MLIDIHVHTNRYSACGRATPEEMVARACAIGLGGLVITEHHIRWGAAELAALQAQFPAIKLFSGIEVSSPELDDYLIYGVSDPDVWAPPIDPARLIPRVRAAGGVVILAHPYRYRPEAPAELDRYPVDGVEVMSNNILNHAHIPARALAARLGAFATAASDAHRVETLGLYALRFRRRIADERDLVAALRARAFDLYADRERLALENTGIAAQQQEIERLIALGYDDRQITNQVAGVNTMIVHSLRLGLDVSRPM